METEKIVNEIKLQFDELLGEMNKYKKGYYILIKYFDSLSDEEQKIVHRKLENVGL